MSKPYRTLKEHAQDEFVINKSRFIGMAAPADTEEQALELIAQAKAEYRSATHHCYAYVIGANAGIMRYSDDGEPSGTAGLPIMEVLKQRQLVNCCVVVVRYFGGIHLGAGGLVRAYTKGCVIGVDAAQVVTMAPTFRIRISVPYPQWDKVQHRMQLLPVFTEDSEYTDVVTTTYFVKSTDFAEVETQLLEATDGLVQQLEAEELHYPWPADEESA